MAEKGPLAYGYGDQQGRIAPLGIRLFDGEWQYALGHGALTKHRYVQGDYIEITQANVLLDAFMLRFTATIQQPAMPQTRDVSGHYVGLSWIPTATLKQSHIYAPFQPYTWTKIRAPYSVTAGDVLRISINNGSGASNYDATLTGGLYTAAQLATEIDTALGANGFAEVLGTELDDLRVKVGAAATGKTASIEIKTYTPNPLIDANNHLDFHKKIASTPYPDTAIYGGDDLAAIIAPDAIFTEADVGLPLRVTGATVPANNFINSIDAILDQETVILHEPVVTEGVGFAAEIVGSLWEFSVRIGTWKGLTLLLDRNRTLYTDDLAINTSKFTGYHDLKFRLELVSAV